MKYLVGYLYVYSDMKALLANKRTDVGHCVIDYPNEISPEEFPVFLEHVRQKLGKEEHPVILNVQKFPL